MGAIAGIAPGRAQSSVLLTVVFQIPAACLWRRLRTHVLYSGSRRLQSANHAEIYDTMLRHRLGFEREESPLPAAFQPCPLMPPGARRPLIRMARAIFAEPESLPANSVTVAIGALVDSATPVAREQARSVLQFLLATEHAESVVAAVEQALSQEGREAETYQALCSVLSRYAAGWACDGC